MRWGGRGTRPSLVLVLLLATVALASPVGPPEPLVGQATVDTDRNCYLPGEDVTVVLRSVGTGPLFYTFRPDFEIESPALGAVREVVSGFVRENIVLDPGQSLTWTWNQTWHRADGQNEGQPVPSGGYEAAVRTQAASSVITIGTAPFAIGDCLTQIDAGPDLVVDEREAFRFSPTIRVADEANLTSVTWDLDPTADANGDGNATNDADLIGETPEHAFGDDGVYTVTMNVRGFVENVSVSSVVQDMVFTIDSSGSMVWNDLQDLRKEGAKAYVDLLVPPDRAAVVDFDGSAHLVNGDHLSSNYTRVKANIDAIDSIGSTFLGGGLLTAIGELRDFGDAEHLWVMIFLTDAESVTIRDRTLVPQAVEDAKALGIRIYTVGLTVPTQLVPLMEEIANETGGIYFPAPTADALLGIYEDIAEEVQKTRGEFVVASDTLTVTVRNVAPMVSADVSPARGPANVTLRVAGEKYHDVALTLYRDGSEVGNVTVYRVPGNPDAQSKTLESVTLDDGSTYEAVVVYTPPDDPINGQVNGANPAWVLVDLANGTDLRFRNTFNVQHPETWVWVLHLTGLDGGGSGHAVLTANVADPGSDDITVTVDWGDGTVEVRTYFHDGVGPDPFPSPGGEPADVSHEAVHDYGTSGTYTVTLLITDDDGGETVLLLTVTL